MEITYHQSKCDEERQLTSNRNFRRRVWQVLLDLWVFNGELVEAISMELTDAGHTDRVQFLELEQLLAASQHLAPKENCTVIVRG